MPPDVTHRAAERVLLEVVDGVWASGWQPAELHRQGRLGCATAAGARLVGLAIATDHVRRRSTGLDHRWVTQVDGLGLPRVDGRAGWLAHWGDEEGLDHRAALAATVDVLATLVHLPPLDPLLPPPGSTGSGPGTAWSPRVVCADGGTHGEADPVLARIRALLAKAESTTFEAEATACTVKAQQLMTRHAIDAALVHGRPSAGFEQPIAIRLFIDAPYVDAKALLLQTVAGASRCRTIALLDLAMSTVIGFPGDVAAVELLFTSLLVQAQRALAEAAAHAAAGTRTRSQSYRSAFLLAYTNRIGERLDEINTQVFAEVEAEQGGAFLPVLRSRSAAIDDLVADRYEGATATPVRRGYDAAGWAGGRAAADSARLHSGELSEEARAG